jgi:hypothetical protein
MAVMYITSYCIKGKPMSRRISSAQLRAARALIRWSALDLAEASKVGVATIRRVEVVDGEIPITLANEAALRRALEAAGVEFIDENGGGPGVRLNKPKREPRKK